ncbi:MAG TPA: hypothetical protein VI409_11230 [Gaiellaceae bacterium]|nr:hypothetical protein [Gaiellaceae bacterium]
MTALAELVKRPPPDADPTQKLRVRNVAIAVGLAGVALVAAALVGNLLVASDDAGVDNLFWTFGVSITGFATLKLGIALVLTGIVVRLWMRVDAVRAALPHLKADSDPEGNVQYGNIETPFGPGTLTEKAPGLLPPQAMARIMWKPMILMGPMLVLVGLALSFATTGADDPDTSQALWAWTQGTQFLGEAMLLAGISFLLGTILAGLREGGGEVQESLGLAVKTLRMPTSAKFFLVLMFTGLMLGIAQFVLYGIAAYVDDPATWFAWLGPLRELSLGILLSGIVLALFTIGTVLGFQHWRIRQIIETGR